MVFLAGCATEQPATTAASDQYDLTDPVQYCQYAAEGLSNPWMNDFQKQVLLERMRNAGCMG